MKTSRRKAVKKKIEKTLMRTILPWRLFCSGTKKIKNECDNQEESTDTSTNTVNTYNGEVLAIKTFSYIMI